tara:strand:+ start:1230 stop:1376 length:147 start_codon:yes stop_codon:yes gene_type:complete
MWLRGGRSSLTEDRVFALSYAINEDDNKAQKQVAQFIIDESKRASKRR